MENIRKINNKQQAFFETQHNHVCMNIILDYFLSETFAGEFHYNYIIL